MGLKILPKKLNNKSVLKKAGRVTVEIPKPVTEDRSRFFDKAVKEERKRLFFK